MSASTSTPFVEALYAETVRTPDRLFGEQYYGPFLNWGYWKSDTLDQVQACRNLVDLVIGQVPFGSRVLEVGAGLGGVTEHLLRRHPDSEITGINIRADQVEVARRRVPAATFVEMDATQMTFPDGNFGTIVCIEAAFHFPSRIAFFENAHRVLAPGGYLAMADIISVPFSGEDASVVAPADYQALLYRLGFDEVRVSDVTRETSWAHAARAITFLERERDAGRIDDARCLHAIHSRMVRAAACRHYVTIVARKPVSKQRRIEGEAYLAELRAQLIATATI